MINYLINSNLALQKLHRQHLSMMAANGDVNDVEMGLLENQNDEDFLNSKSLKFHFTFSNNDLLL